MQAYYRAVADHDVAAAIPLLQPSMQWTLRASDSDFVNVANLNLISVSKGVSMPGAVTDTAYEDIVQVDALYYAAYKQVITSISGKQVRFIYVGRLHGTGPWQILSIGTGP